MDFGLLSKLVFFFWFDPFEIKHNLLKMPPLHYTLPSFGYNCDDSDGIINIKSRSSFLTKSDGILIDLFKY